MPLPVVPLSLQVSRVLVAAVRAQTAALYPISSVWLFCPAVPVAKEMVAEPETVLASESRKSNMLSFELMPPEAAEFCDVRLNALIAA